MSKCKVLLVDDEKEFVTALAERLELRGFQVLVALDGQRALGLIETDLPQVVVLDLKMPGIGGLEVLKRIKAQSLQIPVIILTGHGSMKEGKEGMDLGAFDHLIKPIDIAVLIEKIKQAAQVFGCT
ncbi:MAG: response regulator [Deltaproteobacteria bacterium]|nr:MAG: response regulator [Deltaproteobacteria bacterium]